MTIAPIRRFYAAAAGLALIAGFLLIPLADETDRFFSWTIAPPITAAFLGAAYWAAFVLLVWAARQREWALARVAMPPVATIAVLLLVITLIHLDKFDLDSVFGWFWVVVYVLVTPLLAFLVIRQRREVAPPRREGPLLPPPLRMAVGGFAVVLLGFGSFLLGAPADAASAWPWPITPLTGRAIGSFLVGFGVAAAFVLREPAARLGGIAWAFATLAALELLVLLAFSEDLTASAAGKAAYAGFWGLALLASLAGARAASAASRAASGSR